MHTFMEDVQRNCKAAHAVVVHGMSSEKSLGSCRAGTPVYMAPEVFRREYGVQSDMWSLGMMLYHFISQRFPFW